MNHINNLLKNVLNYFTEQKEANKLDNYRKVCALIRIPNEKLFQSGDVVFPIDRRLWSNYIAETNSELNENAFKISPDEEVEKEKFLNAASLWEFPVERLVVSRQMIYLYLKRTTIVGTIVPEVLSGDKYGCLQKTPNKDVYLNSLIQYAGDDELTFYRSKLVHAVLKNLLEYSRYNVVDIRNSKKHDTLELRVQSIGYRSRRYKTGVTIKCGLVIDPLTGKRCEKSTDEYMTTRSARIIETALRRYEIHDEQDSRIRELKERLGYATVSVDLLEVKHTSPVRLTQNYQGSTKGASFMLYNFGRMETILRNFHEKVNDRQYDPLPSIDTIQLDLLAEEEEWHLIYVYLAGFPNLIDRCMSQLETGLCPIHIIIQFLHGFVSTFSVYYRRIKILTENRDHLMPQLYARIYLIKALREVLNKAFALLDIEPLEFM